MHDPTEGGVLGAAWEMAEASGVGVRIDAERIPVREATRAICAALALDPLTLIASGAMLIACRDPAPMLAGLHQGGIAATHIGDVTDGPRVVRRNGREEPLAPPGRDELYRMLENQTGT